jgi:hypothetical protein
MHRNSAGGNDLDAIAPAESACYAARPRCINALVALDRLEGLGEDTQDPGRPPTHGTRELAYQLSAGLFTARPPRFSTCV